MSHGAEMERGVRHLLLTSAVDFLTEPSILALDSSTGPSTFHKAHSQITDSPGLGSHDGSIQQSC